VESKIINEGLRPYDLKEMVHPIFEVDTYSSKMGEDRDVCVISFKVLDRAPAKDLMEFIEKGFGEVLDADVSSGENEDGEYSVFVELKRNPNLTENIKEILYGVRKLTGIDAFKFKYYKESNLHEVNTESLTKVIPNTPMTYDGLMVRIQTENVKRFFSKTLMDDLTLDGDIVTIHKPFNKSVQLKMIKEADTEAMLESISDTLTVDEQSSSEMFWLTKVLGDYNISKFGENFLFTNGGKSMLLKRI
jgi:hypothetical protein